MGSATLELEEHRKQASEQSLGSSDDRIYQTAIRLLSDLGASGSHLDYGTGRGAFLQVLGRELPQLQLSGIDLMEKPEHISDDINWHASDLNKTSPLTNAQFDSITAIEVIEHLENPRHVFRELFRLLKPQGKLVLSTPNNESWRSLLSFVMRGHFVAFTDSSYPAHITALNRQDLEHCATEAGFAVQGFAFTDFGCLPGMTSLTWQQISGGWLGGLRYSDNFFITAVKD